MADGIEIDTTELAQLSRVLQVAGPVAESQARPVMQKAGVVMKDRMRADLRGSRHFRGAAPDVTFDTTVTAAGIDLEVGPRSGRGNPGAIANVAYFGTSRGGGTVADPEHILVAEAAVTEQYLADLARDLL